MSTLNTLKRLQKLHSICGSEELFTNYCFRYGVIVKEYRNEIEREVFLLVDSIEVSLVLQLGVTISTTLKIKI